MKRVISLLLALIMIFAAFDMSVFAMEYSESDYLFEDETEDFLEESLTAIGSKTVTVKTKESKEISVQLPAVDFDDEFSSATTTYSEVLAEISSVISATRRYKYISYCKNVLSALGFSDIQTYDISDSDLPNHATAFYTASQSLERNGESTKLYIVSILDTNKSGSEINADFLNKESGNTLDYDSDSITIYSDEADRIYEIIKKDLIDVESDENYVVWITGHSHGANVANCLAKKLDDEIGTSRVAAYLFSVGNTDKNAASENSSRYYNIFNINILDDIGIYLPLSSWGYGRWGVDVNLGLPTDNTETKDELKSLYKQFTTNADRDAKVSLNSNYQFFSDSGCNGVQVTKLVDNLEGLIPSIKDYYTKELSTKKYNNFWDALIDTPNTKNVAAYSFIKEMLDFLNQDSYDTDDITSYGYWLFASFRNSCDVHYMVKFICEYGFGITDVGSILKDLASLHLDLNELIINHLSETYMMWTKLSNREEAILNYDSLPCNAEAESKLTSGDVVATSNNGFYSDQEFSAVANVDSTEYTLSLKYKDGEACEAYNNDLTLTIPSNGLSQTKASFTYAGKVIEIDGRYNAAKQEITYQLPSLNGTLSRVDLSKDIIPDVMHVDYSEGNICDMVDGEEGTGTAIVVNGTGLAGAKALYQTENNSTESGLKYSFDNDNDKPKIKDSFSMESYFYLSDPKPTATQDVFSSQNSSGFGIEVAKNNGGLKAYAHFGSGYETITKSLEGVSGWIHAVITYDGDNLSFYVNNQKVNTIDVSKKEFNVPSLNSIFVCADANEGAVADVAQSGLTAGSMVNRANLYSWALTAAEINQLYSNLPVAADVLSINYSRGEAKDLNGHTYSGTATFSDNSGLVDSKALFIDGTTNSVLSYTVGDNDYAKIKNSFTMESYFYLSDPWKSKTQDVFSNQHKAGLGIEISKFKEKGSLGTSVMFGPSESNYIVIRNELLKRPAWVHAVITFDGEQMAFYVNGKLVDSTPIQYNYLAIPPTKCFCVGSDPTSESIPDAGYCLSNGSMINFANLYSKALTAEQVKQIYQNLPSNIIVEGEKGSEVVSFGVLSDVHIEEDAEVKETRLANALNFLKSKNAISTFITGDLTDGGTAAHYEIYKAVIDSLELNTMTIHESCGNHDAKGTWNDFESYTDDSLYAHYLINGYHFIKVSPDNSQTASSYDKISDWLKREIQLAAEDTGDKPIFVFAHQSIKNTVYCSNEWYGGLSKDIFVDYPQVVLFTGHSHASNNNPNSIWQDDFTIINVPSLAYVSLEEGYGTPETAHTPENASTVAQGLFISVEGSIVTVTTYSFADDPVLVNEWTFDTSTQVTGDRSTFKYNSENLAAKSKAPYFEEGAVATVDDVAANMVTVTIPQAKIPEDDIGDIVHSYRFIVYNEKGGIVKDIKAFSGFFITPMPEYMTYSIPGVSVNDKYSMDIYPINAYGIEGDPISVSFASRHSLTHAADIFDVNFASGEYSDRNGHTSKKYDNPSVILDEDLNRYVAKFDGSNDGYRYAFTQADYENIAKGFTMELYVKPDYNTGSNVILGNMDSAGFGFQYTKSTKQVETLIYVDGSGYVKLYADAPQDVWVHLVLTYDGSIMKLFKNGELVDSKALKGVMKIPRDSAKYLYLGGDTSSSGGLNDASGSTISLFRIYGGCFTESEIQTRYKLALMPQADIIDIDFNSSSMQREANGHEHMTCGKPAAKFDDIIERGYAQFDGVDDGYRYALKADDYEKLKAGFSMELYVKPDYSKGSNVIVGNMDDAGFGFQYQKDDGKKTGKIETLLHDGKTYVRINTAATEGEWVHLVFSFDGTNLKLYKNGELTSSTTISGTFKVPGDKAKYVYLGGDTSSEGTIQDITASSISLFRVYSSCLSEEEIQTVYSAVTEKISFDHIEITSSPNKTQYIEGESFDSTGMVVTAYYNNGVTEKVTDYTLDINGPLKSSDTKISITYNGMTVECPIEVIVETVIGIRLKSEPVRNSYIVNMSVLDLTGGVIEVAYNVGRVETIDIPSDKVMVSGFDITKEGKQTLTFTYKGAKCTFDVTVGNTASGQLSKDLTWTYNATQHTMKFEGTKAQADAIFAACYNGKGQLISCIMKTNIEEVTLPNNCASIILFLADGTLLPLCRKVKI